MFILASSFRIRIYPLKATVFHMCLEFFFSSVSLVTILTAKWFFSCMYHNMSFHIGSDARFYRSNIFLGAKWTLILKCATNRRMDFNRINLQNNQNKYFISKINFQKIMLCMFLTIDEFSYVNEDLLFDYKQSRTIRTNKIIKTIILFAKRTFYLYFHLKNNFG